MTMRGERATMAAWPVSWNDLEPRSDFRTAGPFCQAAEGILRLIELAAGRAARQGQLERLTEAETIARVSAS